MKHDQMTDNQLLEAIGSALQVDAQRRPEDRAAFTKKTMEAANSRSATSPRSRIKLYAIVASALLLSAMVMMMSSSNPYLADEQRLWQLRSESIPIAINHSVAIQVDQLEDIGAGRFVLMFMDHGPERCLWIYPQDQMGLGKEPLADVGYLRLEKWWVTVSGNSLTIPPDVWRLLAGNDPVALSVAGHLELWDRQALQRHLARKPQ